jgi:hypothetical protein
MNNRSPLCLALDFCGLTALTGAGLALGAALWFTTPVAEGVLLAAVRYGLMAATGALLGARVIELGRILRGSASAGPEPVQARPDNVEPLPERGNLPRAA